MTEKKYNVGSRVLFRKKHPCGGETWEVIRIGMDIKVKCETCSRLVMMPRKKFEKRTKKILNEEK